MTRTVTYTEFARELELDPAATHFLSTVYYYTQQAGGEFCKTQQHLQNLSLCSPKQQRRVRKVLVEKGLMTERWVTTHTEEDGFKTRLYYQANLKKLDALLEKAEKPVEQPEESQPTETTEARPDLQSVKMNLEWLPDDNRLISFLRDYDIDPKFAIHFALPEFVGFWAGKDREHTALQWQAKLHDAIQQQWAVMMGKQRRNAVINAAADEKAMAVAQLKQRQAESVRAESRRYETTVETLSDLSWMEV